MTIGYAFKSAGLTISQPKIAKVYY